MSSPTQRSLAEMRQRGYLADVVERWIPGANVRRDCWGFVDILCIVADPDSELFAKDKIIGVQATSWSNVSARVRKIAEHENVGAVRRAGIKIIVLGWKKNRDGRWVFKEVDCS